MENNEISPAEADAEKRKAELEKIWVAADPDTVYSVWINNLFYTALPELSRFTRLKSLHAANNLISSVRRSDLSYDSLEHVNFSNNEIKRIKFGQSAKLTSVKLSENRLNKIPRSIRKLNNLEVLELEYNRIRRIPRFLLKIENLRELNLNFNRIKLNEKAVKRLAKINTILLAGNDLHVLPENINELTGTRKLNFSKNKLADLPDSFSQLDSLTNLIFYQNEFEEIPDEIL